MCKDQNEQLVKSIIGSTLTRGGACTYTVKGYYYAHSTIMLEYNSNIINVHFDYAVKSLAAGNWKFKECTNREFIRDSVAFSMYNDFIKSGWRHEDLVDLHDKNVQEMLENLDYKNLKSHQIRQIIQNISKHEQSKESPIGFKTLNTLKLKTNWQHYDAYSETYSTKEEENIMNKTTNITVNVPTSAYTETNVITMYGKEVCTTDEQELFALLARIESEQAEFKAINKSAKSTRVTNKINALGAARNKVVAMIDALPEE